MDEKKCAVCKIVKPVSKFGVCSKNKDGYFTKCKNCRKIEDSKNPKKVKEYINNVMWGLNSRDY